jgi:hypothetical protein
MPAGKGDDPLKVFLRRGDHFIAATILSQGKQQIQKGIILSTKVSATGQLSQSSILNPSLLRRKLWQASLILLNFKEFYV